MMNKLRKKNRGTIMMAVGLALVLAAVGLTAYNFWDETRAESALAHTLSELDSLAESGELGSIDDRIVEIPGMYDIPAYVLDPEMDMPVATIDGNRYIGFLEIAALGLRLPVMEDWSYPGLKISPCRYSGSAYLNNMVVAGHNYRSHFSGLKRLRLGDEIWFIDMDGNLFAYTVEEMETVAPTDIERMITGDWDLTLFTCTYGGQTRFAVRCTLQTDLDM